MKTEKVKTKRIKRVFGRSAQVYHLWANEAQDNARTGGRSRAFFEGTSAYSYGTHYEVGRITEYNGVKLALINNRGYSNTTSKHIGQCYDAVSGLMLRLYTEDFNVLNSLVREQDKLISGLFDNFTRIKFYSGYKFNEHGKYGWQTDEIVEFNTLCEKLGHRELALDISTEFVDLIQEHVEYRNARENELNSPENQAKKETKRLKELELLKVKNADSIEAWRGGGQSTSFIYSLRPMLLRVNNGKVETSAGAEVPLDEARKLLSKIELGKAKAGDKVGSFTFNNVTDNGVIKIGCHVITLDEAQRIKTLL